MRNEKLGIAAAFTQFKYVYFNLQSFVLKLGGQYGQASQQKII